MSTPPAFVRTATFAPLAHRDFRLLLLGFMFVHAAHPLQAVTQIFWLQELAPEDSRFILVGLVGAVRGGGMVVLGLLGGALADRYDRRRLLLAMQASALVINVIIGGLMFVLSPESVAALGLVFALTFVGSGQVAVGLATRQAMAPEVLGPRLTLGGLALMLAAMQLVFPLAIFLAGMLVDALGAPAAYTLSGVGHGVGLLTLLALRYQPLRAPNVRAPLSRIVGETLSNVREGLHFTRSDATLLWVVALFVLVTSMVIPAAGMLGPTWITTVVGASLTEFSLISLTWAAGALVMASVLTRFPNIERKGLLFTLGVLLVSAGFVVFSVGHTWQFAVGGNLMIGMGMATAQVTATALVVHLTPNEVRGRVLGLLVLSLATVQILSLPVASAGQVWSFETVFPILAFVNLGVVVVIIAGRRQLWRARVRAAESAELAAPAGGQR